MKFRPNDVAKEVGVTVNTVRNWCRDYAEFLSEGAQPGQGNRELNERDIEVFRYIAQLRKENMQQPQIVLRLRETSIGQIVPAPSVQEAAIEPASPQEGLQQLPAVIEAITLAVGPLAARVETLERNKRDTVIVFAAGFLCACGLFLLILLLFVLFGGQ